MPGFCRAFFYLVKTIFYFLPYSFAEGFNSRPQQCENRFPFAAKTSSYNIVNYRPVTLSGKIFIFFAPPPLTNSEK